MSCCESDPVIADAWLSGSFCDARVLERVEVVPVAHVDDRLAPVLDLLEVRHDVGRRRERHVRAVANLARPLGPSGPPMMSLGFRPLPAILVIASSSRLRSYVMSIAIDEGPVETMPNMSPSWISVFEMRLKRSRMRPVLRKSRCRSSTNSRKMRPAASLRRSRRRQDDALLRRRRGRGQQVHHAPAVHERERGHVLRDAVFEDLDVLPCEVGTNCPLASRAMMSVVTRLISNGERRLDGLVGRSGRRRRRGLRRHGHERAQHARRHHPAPRPGATRGHCLHASDYSVPSSLPRGRSDGTLSRSHSKPTSGYCCRGVGAPRGRGRCARCGPRPGS